MSMLASSREGPNTEAEPYEGHWMSILRLIIILPAGGICRLSVAIGGESGVNLPRHETVTQNFIFFISHFTIPRPVKLDSLKEFCPTCGRKDRRQCLAQDQGKTEYTYGSLRCNCEIFVLIELS